MADLAAYASGKRELKDLAGFSAADIEKLRARAQFYVDKRHVDRALMLLDLLAQLDRTDPQPQLVAVQMLADAGRGREAESRVAAVLRREPDNPDALVLLAKLHLGVGNLRQVVALLERVLVRDPEAKSAAGKRARALAAKACAALS